MNGEKDLNLLTKRLMAEGHTADDHPSHVRVCASAWGKELWQNLAGGFEYTSEHLREMVFKTGCGLLVKGGKFATGDMSYMGVDWTPENDNPVITCPYRKQTCDLRNPILGGPRGQEHLKILGCDCHETDEPYDYEKSLEKIIDDENEEMRARYEAFSESKKGHACYWHMRYDYQKKEWKQRYDPMECARRCQRIGGICSLTHKPVSKKKGNVFYDIKISHVRNDGTLFDGETIVEISKGARLFETAKSMTICEQAAKRSEEHIRETVRGRYHMEILLFGWKVEILNVRAEQRESRDLLQDLKDIKNGIRVSHESDRIKREKERKKERRREGREKKIKKLEKKILEVGYHNLEEYSLDRIHADKWLGKERIGELEEQRKRLEEEKRNQPVQLSMF